MPLFPTTARTADLDQRLLLHVCLGLRLLEVQVRLIIGMLGALGLVQQAVDREQLDAREFLPAALV